MADDKRTRIGAGDPLAPAPPRTVAGSTMRPARTEITPPGPRPARTEITPRPSVARTEITEPTPAAAGRTQITPEPAHSSSRTEIAAPPASPVTPAPTPTPGTRVAQFEVIRELGRGGMGQVFLVRDTALGRLVALKFLGTHAPELAERFLVEARATARCQHENIVVIYEVDEWEGQPFLALEYLEGETLSALMTGGRTVSPSRAVELMLPVVRALARAHDHNIVHRDLKPDNIFVQSDGVVKVLDFGIAKLFETDEAVAHLSPEQIASLQVSNRTAEGGLVGTMPYMSPEQWGADAVDHRTDLWAVGVILWELVAGSHPLAPLTPRRLQAAAAVLETPMPRIGTIVPDLPAELERVIDRCLAKRKTDRFASAALLADELEALLPGRYGRRLAEGESPYPGMTAFGESDANRFFGRDREITHMVQKLSSEPMVGVVGPSGVGKSSFVRAGVIPALRASGEVWETLVVRPGRDPLGDLANQLGQMSSSTNVGAQIAAHESLVGRLRAEPGFLGTVLRERAGTKRSRILLFVDQLEELYTLVADASERRAFAACLTAVADDAASPLRVIVSMRSDFLDRAAEDRVFLDRLTRGLMFLPPVGPEGMREALVSPLDAVGYRFESTVIVGDMLDDLENTPGALPLLQFTAAKLWDARDRRERLLTVASYRDLGGLAGALAGHADAVLARLTAAQRRLARTLFLRLVTSELTRSLVDVDELCQLGDPTEVRQLLDHLVAARLLVVHGRGEQEGAAVEIVHESLIISWPSFRRWIEEASEDSAFLEQLRSAAKQWEQKGFPVGLLWRGDAMEEARRFQKRYTEELPVRERQYLDAVAELATRATRRRRAAIIGAFAVLAALVVAATIALFVIRDARDVAMSEADNARAAEATASDALATIKAEMEKTRAAETARDLARTEANEAQAEVVQGTAKLNMTFEQLADAYRKLGTEKSRAERAKRAAEKAASESNRLADSERRIRKDAERLLVKERAEKKKLKEELRKLSTKLR